MGNFAFAQVWHFVSFKCSYRSYWKLQLLSMRSHWCSNRPSSFMPSHNPANPAPSPRLFCSTLEAAVETWAQLEMFCGLKVWLLYHTQKLDKRAVATLWCSEMLELGLISVHVVFTTYSPSCACRPQECSDCCCIWACLPVWSVCI